MDNGLLMRLIPLLVVLVLVQIVLIIIGLRDLLPRSAEQIRGPKVLWGILMVFLSGGLGVIFYFLFGRKER